MMTNEMINLLSMNIERVDRRLVTRSLSLAVAAGAAASLVVSLLTLGVRPDLAEPGALTFLVAKLFFSATVVLTGYSLLTRLARPGGERTTRSPLVLIPFVAVLVLAGISLSLAPSAHWQLMIVGDTWLECLLSIPTIAVLPFAFIVWTVRQVAAPTDLVRIGAFSGLVAGGVSAMGYALHCTEDSLPFVAVWYGGTIALCTLAGAFLGPRLLRW